MSPTFFRVEDSDGAEVFTGNDAARGPWDPASCHAGPPTALLARACEQVIARSDAAHGVHRRILVRLTVDLARPIPIDGFTVAATVDRAGRATAATSAVLTDLDGGIRVRAFGLHRHLRPSEDHPYPSPRVATPDLAESEPGGFPIQRTAHGLPGFSGNAIGRNAEPDDIIFINPDLTITLHREPEGEWMGTDVMSHWEPNGIGVADAMLFDHRGPVGRAVQTILLRKQA